MAQPIWNTPAGSLGTCTALSFVQILLSGSPVSPATSVTYTFISGSLPSGLTLNSTTGIISGTTTGVIQDTSYTFAIRLTDNLGNLRDRTFTLIVSGSSTPEFTTPNGNLLTTNDSVWVELQLQYSNPVTTNPIAITVSEGSLPPGLEINTDGLIRGYAQPPIVNTTIPAVVTTAITTTGTINYITCLSTSNFEVDRPVIFTGSVFGNINSNVTYYIKSIINATTFTISATVGGSVLALSTSSGTMTVTLPAVSSGEPTIKTYSFSLRLNSPLGGDIGSYSIVVINQNASISVGGPGMPPNTRIPTIYNTRPGTFNLNNSDPYYGYYVLPTDTDVYNDTYPPTIPAYFGVVNTDNYFAFKIIGHDFDGTDLTYVYTGLPLGLTGDTITGWITGVPTLINPGINQYTFGVAVYKTSNPSIQSTFFTFSFDLANEITGNIVWVSPSDIGSIFNGTTSVKYVRAVSDVTLSYRIISGELPPNLELLTNGEIAGRVADQPTNELLVQGDTSIFTFTVEAYSTLYPGVKSNKTFTLTVIEEFNQPTDILYIKATPSIEDRYILDTLLDDTDLIPSDMIYRPDDIYFGKASSVVYEHAYGIYASYINEYLAAITKNHYWRNITLGELKTALAKDENGNVIYEVVYSQVVDNLVNPQGISVSKSIYWPKSIDLQQGPWYTSVTNIFTSYSNVLDQLYYTSLSPGYVRTLYPNSLQNMRTQVADILGQEYNSNLLPLWMTSQQENGSTLGYVPAWVICYTKPGFSTTIKNNINNNWKRPEGTPYTLNEINFRIDRFSVDKSITYNYDKYVSPPSWTGLPSGTPVPDPLDSEDFYVLFPHQTILPNR